jgi:hypothetical protein
MATDDNDLILQELLALRRDLATVLTNQEATALRLEQILAALETLLAALARPVEHPGDGSRSSETLRGLADLGRHKQE